jgi:hypothetical protein
VKWIIIPTVTAGVAAIALALLSLSGPSTTFTSAAYASKMDGKPYGAHARNRRAACFNGACRKPK